ncbi:MAG: 50S ribosomal protein L4 [Candidatus Cloacimonetes bacterium]|jgi:large subunit ribosomal protein L4|nr:50S ribosomal protein L4 [Candidatus Cloacimonadota bacterium]MDD4157356.1 50S ribosomal protein L4 [Candidatus Cloacimonadota bacterium]
MIEAIKFSATGEKTGTIELPENLFAVSCNNPKALLYEVINMYRANQRQGTSCKKSRGEVRGSTRKLFRQKGTGNARVGNNRTPIRKNGGRAFPPKPKDWYTLIPKQKKRLALKLALTMKAEAKSVYVIDDLSFDKPSTKIAVDLMNKILPEKGKKLFVINDSNLNIVKSFTNIEDVKMDRADRLFAYEVLNCKYLILTTDALKKAEEVFVK